MIILGLIISLNWFSSDQLAELRNQYMAAAINAEQMGKFNTSCNSVEMELTTSKGYCTMRHFLNAKNIINPYRKLNEFNEGKKKLDSLISIDHKNIELRYMRHSIQDRVPGFLGYNEHLIDDEHFMSVNLETITDSASYQLIYNYLKSLNK